MKNDSQPVGPQSSVRPQPQISRHQKYRFQEYIHSLPEDAPAKRWWRPLLTAVMGSLYFVFLLIGLVIGLAVVAALISAVFPDADVPTVDELLSDGVIDDDQNPWGVAFMMLLLWVMGLAALLAVKWPGKRSMTSLVSIVGRVRWGLMARATGVIFALYALGFLALLGIGVMFNIDALLPEGGLEASVDRALAGGAGTVLAVAVVVLLTTPLQSAGEELVFRGFVPQVLGQWLPADRDNSHSDGRGKRLPVNAIIAFGLPIPLFVVGHDYGVYGMVDVAIFAVCASYLTWRTGGLELAISLHAASNTVLFLFITLGLMQGSGASGGDESFWDFGFSTFLTVFGAWLLLRLYAAKMQNTTAIVAQ